MRNITNLTVQLVCIGLMPFLSTFVLATPVSVCGQSNDTPPFLFHDANDPQGILKGLTVDLLRAVMSKIGHEVRQFELLPWKRCTELVASGRIDMMVNVPTAELDPTPYYISEPYVSVHNVYFFSRRLHPGGIQIKEVGELAKYKICGMMGDRFDAFGLRTELVDVGANSFDSLTKKLEAGRCDLFIAKREVVDNLGSQSASFRSFSTDASISRRDLPEDVPSGLHFAISRKMADGENFYQQVDGTLRAMQASKELDRIRAPYIGPAPTTK